MYVLDLTSKCIIIARERKTDCEVTEGERKIVYVPQGQ